MADALGENDWDDWEDTNRQGVRNQLRWALQALACDGIQQIQLFPARACKPFELADDFATWANMARSLFAGLFTPEQLGTLQKIDSSLEKLSREDEALWTDDALHSRPEWEELRSMAKVALGSFGWPIERPPEGRSRYISGN
jgi:hypothetical protein